MNWVVGVVGVALLLCGCGFRSGDGDRSPTPDAAVDPGSAQAITERDVATLLRAVPVPPGARPAASDESRSITVGTYSPSDHRVDRYATYVVPMSTTAVLEWYGAHRPPGTKVSGESMSAGQQGLQFDARRQSPAYVELQADVEVKTFGDGSLVRLDAQATWLPDSRPARVPNSMRSVSVVQVFDDQTVHRGRLTGAPLRHLAHLINRQHVVAPGTYNCPSDRGAHDVLTFHGPGPDRRYRLEVEGCGFITVEVGTKTLPVSFYGGGLVDHLVTTLLRPRR